MKSGNKKTMNSKVSTPFIDECYNQAREYGALGGKLLGAGQSGYLLLYASPLYQPGIKENLEEKGCHLEHVNFTEKGLEVWSTAR